MKLYDASLSRAEYVQIQVARSEAKFRFCKVSVEDVRRYASILGRHRLRAAQLGTSIGPILCLGTRNGREIDLFRTHVFGPRWRQALSRRLEKPGSFRSWWPHIEGLGRSHATAIDSRSVIGVELNPSAARSDVWVGSFDAMPDEWGAQFGVVYSNSFDQSQDPVRSAAEWTRVVRPGGYLIFCYANDTAPTPSDPVGGLSLADVRDLFAGDLVYFHNRGSSAGYSEVILRVGKVA